MPYKDREATAARRCAGDTAGADDLELRAGRMERARAILEAPR